MTVRGTLGGIFAAGAVLVIGWQVGQAATAQHTVSLGTTPSGSTTSTGGASTTSPSASATASPSASASSVPTASSSPSASRSSSTGTTTTTTTSGYKNGTFTGASEATRYGDVQVSVTISGGKIVQVDALHLTDRDPRSQEISSQAAPILHDEVLRAQSAKVDMVSGATYTSEGYLASLQSALDHAA